MMDGQNITELGCNVFEKELKVNRYSRRYASRVLKNVNEYVEYLNLRGIKDIRKASKKEIVSYYVYLGERPNRKRDGKLARTTVAGIISSISMFYSSLYRNEIISENPFHTLNLGIKHENNWKRRPLTKQEMTDFLEQIETDTPKGLRDRTMFELIYSSGLRACEVSNLKTGDINFERREMIVRGKFGTDRMVPVSQVAKEFLILYLGKRIEASDSPVFPGENGVKGITVGTIGSTFRSYAEKFGMKKDGICVHSIRHSTATHLLDNGASIRHVQELLGHRNIKTTERYTHVQTEGVGRIYRKYHPREHELFDAVDDKYMNDVDELINKKLSRRIVKSEPAENLKRLRYTAGISRKQLAQVTDLPYSLIAEYERKCCSIPKEKAAIFANLFNVEIELFL